MKKRVWITGASSGIGKAVAMAMASRGYELIISGRNQGVLDEITRQTGALSVAFDIRDRNSNLKAADLIKEKFGYLDIVFLNAGTCEYVDVTDFKSDVFEELLKTNFLSMVYAIEASLPLLRASRNAQIVGMSSSVAFVGLPRAEAYGASKAAIRNFLQSLRIDLAKENISVSIVCPGFIKTPLTDKNDFPMPFLISSEAAAETIINGIEKKKLEIITPRLFVTLIKILSFLPNQLSTYLLKKVTNRQ